MNKKVFKTGDIITPEFLNALQDQSFGKQPGEVGHLPLPPNYSEKQQCKTIHVSGANNTVDLRGWGYNAVIFVTPIISNGAAAFPQKLILQIDNITGAIFVIPELGNDEFYIQKGPGNNERICTLYKDEMAIIFTRQVNDEICFECRRIPGGAKCIFGAGIFSSLTTDYLKFGDSGIERITASFDDDFLTFSRIEDDDSAEIKFIMPIHAPSIDCGQRLSSSSAFVGMAANQTEAQIEANSPSGTGGKSFGYSTNSGVMNIFEIPSNSPQKELLSSFAGGKGFVQQTDSGNAASGIYFNFDVDDNLDFIDAVGTICIFNKPNDTAVAGGTLPTKCVITSTSMTFYTYGGSAWFTI